MEKYILDEFIPNHKKLSREEIFQEISNYVEKINNDPEIQKQNKDKNNNDFLKLFEYKNNVNRNKDELKPHLK